MIQNNIQYHLLNLFPKDHTPISYSSIKEMSKQFVDDDKQLKEIIIVLTAGKYLKTNLKGFALTSEANLALQSYNLKSEPIVIADQDITEPYAIDVHNPDVATVDTVEIPVANASILYKKKKPGNVATIVILFMIVIAFIAGFLIGRMQPSEENKKLKHENSQLLKDKKLYIQKALDDSIRIQELIFQSTTKDSLLLE